MVQLTYGVGTDSALLRFLFAQKSVARCVVPPFPKKSYDFSGALPACSARLHSYGHMLLFPKNLRFFGSPLPERTPLCSDFCLHKNQSPAASFLLFPKSLTTFREPCPPRRLGRSGKRNGAGVWPKYSI